MLSIFRAVTPSKPEAGLFFLRLRVLALRGQVGWTGMLELGKGPFTDHQHEEEEVAQGG